LIAQRGNEECAARGCDKLSCDIRPGSLLRESRFNNAWGGHDDADEDDMADDVTLWCLFAAGIAFIWWGCVMTARPKQRGQRDQVDDGLFDRGFDRAA
jgi:hypothetical protein